MEESQNNPQPQTSPDSEPKPDFNAEDSEKNSWNLLILTIVGLLILAGALLLFINKPGPEAGENLVACTTEAKICPDGSSVGRTGPNCEFAECPADPTANWQTYKNEEYGFELKFSDVWSGYKITEGETSEKNRFLVCVPGTGNFPDFDYFDICNDGAKETVPIIYLDVWPKAEWEKSLNESVISPGIIIAENNSLVFTWITPNQDWWPGIVEGFDDDRERIDEILSTFKFIE